MTTVARGVLASVLEAAEAALTRDAEWPNPATGMAYRICLQSNLPMPRFMMAPLRETNGAVLRRTPELAAFGYTIEKASPSIDKLWSDAIEHLRGREIYPSDRQSFILNPIELLGVANGLALSASVSPEQREWFVSTVLRGLNDGQFRSPLSHLAARIAIGLIDRTKAQKIEPSPLDPLSLALPELNSAAGIQLAFPEVIPDNKGHIETTLLARTLRESFSISDSAEAATILVLMQRAIDHLAFQPGGATALEIILTLCRRFPLFADVLRRPSRKRALISIANEYDVQNLLHGILRLHFDDVRPEESTPSLAGNSSRVDFYLPREGIIVEAKMTRENLGQREVIDELLIDVGRYSKLERVSTLVCLIYDPDRYCKNPRGVEDDIENSGGRLLVRVVVCPHGY